MLLTLGACVVEQLPLHGNMRQSVLVDVIWTIVCFNDRSTVFTRQKLWTSATFTNSGRTVRTQASEDTTIVPVERNNEEAEAVSR